MPSKEANIDIFIELVRAGLFPVNGERCMVHSSIDWDEVYRLAEEQSVIGLVAAGLEHLDIRCKKPEGSSTPSQEYLLKFVGRVLQTERRNKDMNAFVAELIEKLRSAGAYGLLVKGQGVAQCYEKPLWRACGDVDLLLDAENYEKAKDVLAPIADEVAGENEATRHQAYVIQNFDVELHGAMPFLLSRRVDKVIAEAQRDGFYRGNVSSWQNGNTTVFIPTPDNHVIFVFTHFLHHFFVEGVGLRQICDWCRLLFIYKDSLNQGLLESRIRKAGLMSEWKTFGSLAVNMLGMPEDAMPFYDSRFKVKGDNVLKRVLKSGNFGQNNDLSYRTKYSGMTYKLVAMWRRLVDFASLVPVFPLDAPRFFVTYVFGKVKGVKVIMYCAREAIILLSRIFR